MGAVEQPWWLDLELFGFEDEDEDDEDDEEDEEEDEDDSDDEDEDDDSDDDSEDDEDSEEDEEDDDESKPKPKKNIEGLKSALRKERMARRKAEKDNKRLKARLRGRGNGSEDKDDDKDKKPKDDEDTGPSEREKRMADRLLSREIDGVVLAVAHKLRFIDAQDAVRLVSRKSIVFDQDDEDPSDIEIDEESVEDAVKELARKKKHLIAPRGSTKKSGSKVAGRRKKDQMSDDEIRKKYSL